MRNAEYRQRVKCGILMRNNSAFYTSLVFRILSIPLYPYGRRSWLPDSFLLHVKYCRIVSYRSLQQPTACTRRHLTFDNYKQLNHRFATEQKQCYTPISLEYLFQ